MKILVSLAVVAALVSGLSANDWLPDEKDQLAGFGVEAIYQFNGDKEVGHYETMLIGGANKEIAQYNFDESDDEGVGLALTYAEQWSNDSSFYTQYRASYLQGDNFEEGRLGLRTYFALTNAASFFAGGFVGYGHDEVSAVVSHGEVIIGLPVPADSFTVVSDASYYKVGLQVGYEENLQSVFGVPVTVAVGVENSKAFYDVDDVRDGVSVLQADAFTQSRDFDVKNTNFFVNLGYKF